MGKFTFYYNLKFFPIVYLQSPWELPKYNLKKKTLYMDGRERPKEEDQSRLVGERFDKQRNLYTGLVCKAAKQIDLCTTHQILKVYIKAFI